ncbi:MAG: porin [Fimbriimonadaceae bacterium]|nr:porin [Fimbriimonadaceae bacterium]
MKHISIAFFSLTVASVAWSQSEWAVGGYLDGYYQVDFGRPAAGNTVNGRGLDIAHQRFTLAVGEFDALYAPTAKRPFGVNIQLFAGKNADLISLTEPGGKNKYKWIRQAYVTYAEPKSGWTVDLGKFDTWIGYEGIDNRFQDQYGRSFNWTYSEPSYAAGLRASGKLSPEVGLALFLVNGWNEVEDANGSPSAGAQLTVTLDPKTSVILQNYFGTEGSDDANEAGSFGGIGFPNAGTAQVHLIDAIVTHQLTPSTKLAFNVDYGTSRGGANTGKWNGEVLYLKHQLNHAQALSLRLERVEDLDGLRVGMPMLLHSITLGYDWAVHKNGTLRFELRRDFANKPFFNDRNGVSSNRVTLTVAAVAKF